jgi:hypothetical protein
VDTENSKSGWLKFPDFCPAKNNPPMFERLQKKWKVSGLQLFLILCSFAIAGSMTGFVAKKIMNALSVEQDWLWAIIYIILITLLWPILVLLVGFFFGQFRFFSNYIRKMGEKMGIGKHS